MSVLLTASNDEETRMHFSNSWWGRALEDAMSGGWVPGKTLWVYPEFYGEEPEIILGLEGFVDANMHIFDEKEAELIANALEKVPDQDWRELIEFLRNSNGVFLS